MIELHSCSYFCERPACIKVQRDEMRDTLFDHIETPECGFDRNASHSAGRYVCACGYETPEQPAGEQNNARARGSDTERVGKVQPSHAAPAPNNLAAMEQRITELTENGARLLDAADGWRASAQHFQQERNELEAQLAEAKSIALDAQSESAAYQAMQERADSTTAAVMERAGKAEGENAALREDAERYRWFRLQSLWDSEYFPWPDNFEYPEGISESEMLDAAIDAVRKA